MVKNPKARQKPPPKPKPKRAFAFLPLPPFQPAAVLALPPQPQNSRFGLWIPGTEPNSAVSSAPSLRPPPHQHGPGPATRSPPALSGLPQRPPGPQPPAPARPRPVLRGLPPSAPRPRPGARPSSAGEATTTPGPPLPLPSLRPPGEGTGARPRCLRPRPAPPGPPLPRARPHGGAPRGVWGFHNFI